VTTTNASQDSLIRVPTRDLVQEVERRRATLLKLRQRHDELLKELNGLRAEIQTLGGFQAMARTAHDKRDTKQPRLANVIRSVLAGKKMSVEEVTNAVLKTGYKTRSSNFRQVVQLALLKGQKFRRVSRGVYTNK
jgi:hypothetical protein